MSQMTVTVRKKKKKYSYIITCLHAININVNCKIYELKLCCQRCKKKELMKQTD